MFNEMPKIELIEKREVRIGGELRSNKKVNLTISDPYYLENLSHRTELIYSRDFKNQKDLQVKINVLKSNHKYTADNFDFDVVEAFIMIMNPALDFKVEPLENGGVRHLYRLVGSSNINVNNLKTEQKDLGTDTAEYMIAFGDNIVNIHTGADGYYGIVTDYLTDDGEWVASIISLNLSEYDSVDFSLGELTSLFTD